MINRILIATISLSFSLMTFLSGEEHKVKINYETFSPEEIKRCSSLSYLNQFDSNQFMTLLEVANCLELSQHKFQFVRDLVNNVRNIDEMSQKEGPVAISSRGFLPGEKCKLIITDKNDNIVSQEEIFPFPIIKASANDNAYIFAVLRLTQPITDYEIYLCGFDENEKLSLRSISHKENIKMNVTKEMRGVPIHILPDVKGMKGGVAELRLIRASGEVLDIKLPWGDQLTKYLTGFYKPSGEKDPYWNG